MLLLLSLFAWIMALLATGAVVTSILTTISWMFLTIGVGWALAGRTIVVPFFSVVLYPGPWVTGALFCVFVFVSWRDTIPPIAVISWPIVSAIIAAVPKFLKSGFQPHIPEPAVRQELVVLLLTSLLLTCWLQFHFFLQGWMNQYPSISADNFNRSAFVTKLPTEMRRREMGVPLLNAAETRMREQLQGESWPQIERWLIDLQTQVQQIQAMALADVFDLAENSQVQERRFWRLQALRPNQTARDPDTYEVIFQAAWSGPSSQPWGYYLQKSCTFRETSTQLLIEPEQAPRRISSEILCQGISQPRFFTDDLIQNAAPNAAPNTAPDGA